MHKLIIDSHNVCELQRLRNAVTGDTVTDATVALTIFDGAGQPVEGQIWPSSMSHVENGLYRTTLEPTMVLRRGGNYVGKVKAIAAAGQERTWEMQIKAEAGKEY